MARHLHRLTATAITKLKTKGLHPDGGGHYVRVTAKGTKSWSFRHTSVGNTRDMGLGAFPTVTLAKARERAVSALS